MKTSELISNKFFTEEELHRLGFEYTSQNFSKYLIYKKEDEYFLMNEVQQDQYKVEFNFADCV